VANGTQSQIKEELIDTGNHKPKTTACVMTFLLSVAFTTARAQTNVSPAETRAIAAAYIYG
jgi:hypothetical protein